MKTGLRPIRTREQCRKAGDSFRGFNPSCLPHIPFLLRLRIAWMVVRGVDLGDYSIDCGGHRIDQVAKWVEQTRSPETIEALRHAAGAFGEDEEMES